MRKSYEPDLQEHIASGTSLRLAGTTGLATLSLLLLVVFFSSCTNNDIKVWVASPWQHVLQNTPPGGLQNVTLRAAANEYEPFRIIVHNESKSKLNGLNVTITSLTSTNGVINASNIQLYRANYLHVTKPSIRSKNPAGWYPDALIPFTAPATEKKSSKITYVAAPFSVDTAMNAEVWCDLYVPAGTKPGTYSGKVQVMMGKRIVSDIPVTLNVWDFELPANISMLSHFGSFNSDAVKMMGLTAGTKEYLEVEEMYNKELLKNRAVPSTPSNIWPEWNEKDGLIEKGETERIKKLVEVDHFNALDIPFRYKDESKKCKAYLAATAKWLKGLGYLDKAYIYLEDEPNDAKEYEIVRRQGALIKAAYPGIARMCTEQTISSDPKWGTLYGAVDIWCPLWGLWDEKTAKERLSKGEKLWSYTALCQMDEGTPFWQVDMHPLSFRSPMWLSWHFDITGFLYWSSVYWSPYGSMNGVWEAPYFRKNYWGEGMLLYPGPPAGITGFVPSIRLKLYREAAEDYEYMTLAAKAGKKNEVDAVVNSLVTNFQKWSHVQNDYEKAREQLADIIVKGK
jgi:hypothetical protein